MSNPENTDENSILEEWANKRISVNMTPREVFNFLVKLSNDDDFRARVEKDPQKVLAEHHIDIPSHAIPFHVSLPPKDSLQQALIDIMTGRETIIRALPFNVDPMYWWFIDFLIFLASPPGRQKPT